MHDNRLSIQDLVQPTAQLTEVSSTQGSDVRSATEEEISEIAKCRISRRPVMMISFRKCNGEVVVLPYSLLRRIVSDDCDRQFRLQFTTEEIDVHGQNLTQLFHYVCEHRVIELVETSRAVMMAESEDCVVETIAAG